MPIGSHVVLPGSQRPMLAGAEAVSAASPQERVEVTVKLRRMPPLPPLDGRPTAPMSRADAAARYGASAGDVAKVKDVLSRFGLTIIREDAATRSVVLAGPVDAMEKAFAVKLFRCTHNKISRRVRSGVLHVPSELDQIVVGVYGLDNRSVIRRRRRRGIRSAVATGTAAAVAAASVRRGFVPSDLARQYAFPDGDGAGQAVGILEFGGRFERDALQLFCERVGVPVPQVIELDVNGGATDVSDDPTGEVMLDVEVVAGVCPKATIPLYFGPGFDERSWIDTIDQAIHDAANNPSILSISWGNPEDGPNTSWQPNAISHVNDALHEAALIGVTVCVASGDDGSDDQGGDGKAHVDFPASSPYVLAVGGTDLRIRNGTADERAWKDGNGLRPDGGSSGGGVSVLFARPNFQSGVAVQPVNAGSILGRVVPDVAAHAQSDGQRTGYFFVVDGPSGPVEAVNGGTSAAAPLWAALIARINAALERETEPGARAGYLTPVLYQAGADGRPIGAGVCKDITAGDNVSAVAGGFHAGPGYDAVTGWGSPIGSRLLDALRAIVQPVAPRSALAEHATV